MKMTADLVDGKFPIAMDENGDLVTTDPKDGTLDHVAVQQLLDDYDMSHRPITVPEDTRTYLGLAFALYDMTGGHGGLIVGGKRETGWKRDLVKHEDEEPTA
jgi:hypothetical protein